MVVAVEKDSSYAQLLAEVDKCVVVDWNDAEGFAESILQFYKSEAICESKNARDVFKKHCSVDNAKKYVYLLEKTGGK